MNTEINAINTLNLSVTFMKIKKKDANFIKNSIILIFFGFFKGS